MTSFAGRIQRGKKPRPRRTVLYGTHGIGKTTWAAQWDRPFFIAFEDGCGDLDVASIRPNDIADAWQIMIELGDPNAEQEFGTLVIDSADWMEAAIQKTIVSSRGKKSLDEFEFGKGYGESAEVFAKMLQLFTSVRDAGLNVVILAHCEIKKYTPPGLDSYDRYTPKLHKTTAALLQEWSDEVLFAAYRTYVRKEDMGFNKNRGVATGGTDRVLYCQESAGWLAKNRLGLPPEMSFDFAEYRKFLV